MTEIVAEQKGGVVGPGGAGAKMVTESRADWASLSDAERAKLDKLFASPKKLSENLYYTLTRTGPHGAETTDARSDEVPKTLIDNLKTTLK